MWRSRASRSRGQSTGEYVLLIAGLAALVTIGILLGLKVRNTLVATTGGISSVVPERVAGEVLFEDDFSEDSGGWRFLGRNWTVRDGILALTQSGERRAFVDATLGNDYTIRMEASMSRGNGYGIFFRSDGSSRVNGYTFQYDPGYGRGQFIMRRWVNGGEQSPFAVADPFPGFQWRNATHEIELAVRGDTFIARVDGRTVLTGRDSTYATGMVGLRAWSNTEATFDDFSVTR